MKAEFEPIGKLIDLYKEHMVGTMSDMIPIKSISPLSGGKGESYRADFLEYTLKGWGIGSKRYEYTDTSGARRPSIVATFGEAEKTIWFIGHIDTVLEGDLSLWKYDPFKATREGDRIYGRGANDDGQGVISSMYALKVLKESGVKLKYRFGLILVADEEIGSVYGMQKLMDESIFKKDDMFVVPDFCSVDGSVIEVGEKGILWMKITVKGVQIHASTPDEGKNAFRYSIKFLSKVDEVLHAKYNSKNALFNPQESTFEMTKHEKNVDSINIIPGIDVSYIDCRILPEYKIDDVLNDVKALATSDEFKDVTISVDVFHRDDPSPITPTDSQVVRLLGEALTDLRGIKPVYKGIGGGTVAAFPRKVGMQAVSWATDDDVAHQPNEYTIIKNMVDDAKTFAYMMI